MKLNIQFILLHTLAIFLCMMAFSNLAFLYDVDLVMAIVRDENLLLQKEASKRIAYFIIAKQTIPFLGLILGVAISFMLAKKHKIAIWNIIIVLLLSLVLFGSDIHQEFQWLSVGQYIADGLVFTFLINAIVLLSIGFLIYFNKHIPWLKTTKE